MPKGSIIAPFNPIVVNTGAKLVLIDTGYGPGIAPTVGLLPATLAAAGIDPKAIDIVLISHMHGDHILGLKTPDGALAFPNAEIKVPSVDWAYWMSDDNMSKAPEGFQKASFGFNRKIFSNLADKVTRYDWGKEVAPGITAVETSGHTPGTPLSSSRRGRRRLFFQGDVSNVPRPVPAQSRLAGDVRQRAGQGRGRRVGASTTWLQPRRSWSPAITSRSLGSATSKRPATAIVSCRQPGARCSDSNVWAQTGEGPRASAVPGGGSRTRGWGAA